MIDINTKHSQRGAALVISLILLLVLTILGVVGMSTATLELAMAGNMQYQNGAFEAADSIVESEILRTDIAPLTMPGPLPIIPANVGFEYRDADNRLVATASANTNYMGLSGAAGWQLGGAVSFSAFHFEINGTATAPQGATANHRQGFFVVGPSL